MGIQPKAVTCGLCGGVAVLGGVRHHWFDDKGRRSDVVSCFSCNSMLKRPKGDNERYLLPPLAVQRWYVRNRKAGRIAPGIVDLVDYSEGRLWELRLPADVVREARDQAHREGKTLAVYLRELVNAAVLADDGSTP